MRALSCALALLALVGSGAARGDDYYLSAPDSGGMSQALASVGLLSSNQSDWDASFSLDWGSNNGLAYVYEGQCALGGSYKIRYLGQLLTPTPKVTIQPPEPGNFTSNVGKPIWPPFATSTNQKVGVESIPDAAPAYWVSMSWNCASPFPASIQATTWNTAWSSGFSLGFGGTGLGAPQHATLVRANTAGAAGGPFSSHF